MDEFERREHEVELRLEEKTVHLAEAFVEYVIEGAGEPVVIESWGVDAVIDVAAELDMNGYDITDGEDESLVTMFANPEVANQIQDAYADAMRVIPNRDSVTIRGVTIVLDRTVPDNTAIAVHHHAIAPSIPEDVHRPWLVKEPTGVVVAEDISVWSGPREDNDD
jgi:hypothetical protein